MKEYFIKVKDDSIEEKIKALKKVIKHERHLYIKHFTYAKELTSELHSLLDERKALFPEQYTKSGLPRKPFRNLF